MASFSATSRQRLETCDPRLQQLFQDVVKSYDCTILQGKRTEAEEADHLAAGRSHTHHSKHVYPIGAPALAVDVAPWPLTWPDPKAKDYVKVVARFYHFAGFVRGVAGGLGLRIRWGGDWDGDLIFVDQTFDDLPHFELLDAP